MYPAGAPPDKALSDAWTWGRVPHRCGEVPEGGLSVRDRSRPDRPDSVDSIGTLFAGYGAVLVDAKGQHHREVRRGQAGARVCEAARGVPSAGHPGVGRRVEQQVADRGQGRADHESAERVGGRQARQPAGRRAAVDGSLRRADRRGGSSRTLPYFWGIWKWSKNKPAAKSLLAHISERSAVEKMVAASQGYDIPSFEKLNDFKTWAEEGPPKGTLYHYPPKRARSCRCPDFRRRRRSPSQIYNQAVDDEDGRQGEPGRADRQGDRMAASELEGFMRA
jgi:hypothetical protein